MAPFSSLCFFNSGASTSTGGGTGTRTRIGGGNSFSSTRRCTDTRTSTSSSSSSSKRLLRMGSHASHESGASCSSSSSSSLISALGHTSLGVRSDVCDSRRSFFLSGVASSLFILLPNQQARAASSVDEPDATVARFRDIDDFVQDNGWETMPSGLKCRVLRAGEGDARAGIFDPVSKFKPFPFVEVIYSAYLPNGKMFAGTALDRKASFSYQVGIRQELQDEDGAVMSMKVGERRQFAVPAELVMENIGGGKIFGSRVPDVDAILVDVQLLSIRPY
mmetsp:Transcript_1414/g.3041  ORF Transcript_1414/g.3041 Transcript_1414/m.3041 type:complete len:277 (-) Transcript_1414:49-879(-)